jgi:hypothetical protein
MLFKNTNLVLDGYTELQRSYDVLVKGDRVVSVSRTPLNDNDAKVIDIGGRTRCSWDSATILLCAHGHRRRCSQLSGQKSHGWLYLD